MEGIRRRSARTMIAFAATLGLAAPALGSQPRQGSATQRPDADAGPTEVAVAVYVIDIEAVDNAKQQYSADFVVDLIWSDLRLAGAPGRRSVHEVWHPQVILFNQRGVSALLPEMVEVDLDGRVRYLQRYYGSLASPFDLRDFPFDTQALPITLVSIVYGPEEVRFVFASELSGRANRFSIAEWRVGAGEADTGTYAVSSTHSTEVEYLSRFDYVFEAERSRSYYVWKVVGPLVIIVLMSWAVFWVDPKHVGPQLGMSATSILTLVAFLLSLGSILPPISYLTRLDHFVYASLALQFLAFAEALASTYLASKDNHPLALRLDGVSRFLFPAGFLAINLWFWT